MKNLKLIISREYLTRVKKKSFIITTLVTPLAIGLFVFVLGFILNYSDGEEQTIAVVDQSGIFNKPADLARSGSTSFELTDATVEELKATFEENGFDAILYIPEIKNLYAQTHTIFFYSEKSPTLDLEMAIGNRVKNKIRNYKIDVLNLDKKELAALETSVDIDPEPIIEGEKDQSKHTNLVAAGIGGFMGFIMYMAVFIYGMMVMRSVMEEKTNRIVEVMISTVKPFELMLGKIIGVGGVGLTQLAIWAVLIPIIQITASAFWGIDTSELTSLDPSIDQEEIMGDFAMIMAEISNQNWWSIIPLFLFYFIGGYLLYASLFAAVGSAIGDDITEGQALTIPITIPVAIAFYIMITAVQSPNSTLAVFSSIFPLFSPIVMPARLAFEPPIWQLLVSMVVLIGTCIFFTWIAGRIYRIGILMYGKKASFKDLFRWFFKQY
jgi:ABC-2 type transport system permease protein